MELFEKGEQVDILNTPERKGLKIRKTRNFAQEVFHFKKVGSTNQIALELARKGYPEGTLVAADEQTAGRGRWQRHWHSAPGKSLLFSLILRPKILPVHFPQITLVAGAATARAVHRQTGIGVGIKWPNDLLYQGKKFCGILVEGTGEANCLVLGIGINVNQERDDFPLQLQDTATSLRMIKGEEVPRDPLLQMVLEILQDDYEEYCRSGFALVRQYWLQYEDILGRKVRVLMGNKAFCGVAVGLAEDGALVLRLPQGEEVRCSAGEVTLCREDEQR